MSAQRPDYIPDSIIGASLDFTWKGAGCHTGPMQTVNPLFDRLGGCTTCGQITLCAGLLLWGSWRLEGHVDVAHNFELAEAAFAAQVDWRYVDRDAGPKGEPPDEPSALSAMMELNRYMRRALNHKKYWSSYYTPIAETFHASYVARHVTPAPFTKSFDTWFEAVVARVQFAAPKPVEEFRRKDQFDSIEEWEAYVAAHRGEPLPPDILDPQVTDDPATRGQRVSAHIANLDWNTNRYLRSPDEMQALRYSGTAYLLDEPE